VTLDGTGTAWDATQAAPLSVWCGSNTGASLGTDFGQSLAAG